jgi:alkylation response protein AidB-like acyl-CoA dehydrogenase
MNVLYDKDDAAFASEVMAFVSSSLPTDIRNKVIEHRSLDKSDYMRWQSILAAKGWLTGNWPFAYGGLGWTAMQTHIFDEVCAIWGTPKLIPFGLRMVAPVIMEFGNAWQKEKFLTPIRENTLWWCQGYSEPNAGSDLAALQTQAVLVDDHYVVNGQKTWTTQAQYADMMFCLVRTSNEDKRQNGISFILLDMHAPGVTVRPIVTYSEEANVNEVFLENVRVPVAHRIGEEGKGWTYAKFLLGHERTILARVGDSKRELATLKRLMSEALANGTLSAAARHRLSSRLMEIELELTGLEVTLLRVLNSRSATPGPETSVLKIVGTQIQQDIAELLMELAGPAALPFDPHWNTLGGAADAIGPSWAAPLAANYFDLRKLSVYGGSNEIQKNIIAQRILGL